MKSDLEKIAYIEMYVSNIFNSKFFLSNALGFEYIDQKSEGNHIFCLMKQGQIYIVLCASLDHEDSVSRHILARGDGVKKISFWVNNSSACYDSSINNGAKSLSKPKKKDGLMVSVVEIFNGVEHEFIEAKNGLKIPVFDYNINNNVQEGMIFNIDHIATCHPANTIGKWAEFYKKAFGFHENKDEDIYSEKSGMHITIMKSPNGNINLPLVEPSSKKSPLNTYLAHNNGAGVHHVAFETNDIIKVVKHYEKMGGTLRKASHHYYESLSEEMGFLQWKIKIIKEYGIMLDKDAQGIMLQIFTKPVVTKPTFFLEFIQRDNSKSFGTANINVLYETLEN